MATVTKRFSFATTSESWTGTSMPTTGSYDSTVGNPAGSLKLTNTGSMGSGTGYMEWSGTWQTLGVPAGQTVQSIQVTSAYERVDAVPSSKPATIGPFLLLDPTSGTAIGTLVPSRVVSAVDSGWVTRSGLAVPVQTAFQPSGTTIKLRWSATMQFGAGTTTAHGDEFNLSIVYGAATEPWPPAYAPPKPHTQQFYTNHRTARGLVVNAPFMERAGTPRNTITRLPSTVTGTMGWSQGMMGIARDPGGQNNSNNELFTASSPFNRQAFTAEVWMRFRSFTTSNFGISGIFFAGNNCSFRLGDNGLPNDTLQFTDGTTKWTCNQPILQNRLYHLVMVGDGGTYSFYINGLLDTSASGLATSGPTSAANLFRDDATGGRGPDAYCECFRVWNRSLTSAEILDLYDNPWDMYDIPRNVEFYNTKAGGSSTSSLTATNSTVSAVSTFAMPSFHATSSPSVTHSTFTAAGTRTLPAYHGSATPTSSHPTMSGSATCPKPVYHGTASASPTHATLTAVGARVVPVFRATMVSSANHATISSSSSSPYRGASSVSATHVTLAAGGNRVVPSYHATSSVTSTHATMLASAGDTMAYSGTASLTAAHTVSASATGVVPTYHGSSSPSATHAAISSSAHRAVPIYSASCVASSNHATISSSSHEAAIYSGSLTLSMGHPTTAGVATNVAPTYRASSSLTASHSTVTASSTDTAPNRLGSASRTATHPTLLASGTCPASFGTAGLASSHAVFAASCLFAIPVYHGSGVLSKQATLASVAHFAPPVYHGSATLGASHGTFAATGRVGPRSALVTRGYGYGQRILFHRYNSGVVVYSGQMVSTSSHATLSVSATAIPPVSYATASLVASHAALASAGTSAVPTYHGTSSPTIDGASMTADVGLSSPIFNGSAGITANNATLTSESTSVVPVFRGSSSVTVVHPTISATATAPTPVYGGDSSLHIAVIMSAAGANAVPVFRGSSASTPTHPSLTSSATFAIPVYGGTSAPTIDHPTISAVAVSVVPVYHGHVGDLIGQHIVTKGYRQGIVGILWKGYGQHFVGPLVRARLNSLATYSLPVYAGTAAIVASHPSVSATGTQGIMDSFGTAALTATHATIDAFSGTAANYNGSGSITVGNATLAALGAAPVPSYAATSVLLADHAFAAARGTENGPFFKTITAMQSQNAEFKSRGVFRTAVYHGNLSLPATHVSMQSFGVFDVSGLIIRSTRRIIDTTSQVAVIRSGVGGIVSIAEGEQDLTVTLSGSGRCNFNPGF